MVKEKKTYIDKEKTQSPFVDEVSRQVEIAQLQGVSFFLERTSESIKRATSIIQELESEISRLRYELMATENEYKNLLHANEEFEREILVSQEDRVSKDI